MPIIILAIVDILQTTLTSLLLLLALLAFQFSLNGLAFGKQRGIGNVLIRRWRYSRLALAQFTQFFYQQATQTCLIACEPHQIIVATILWQQLDPCEKIIVRC